MGGGLTMGREARVRRMRLNKKSGELHHATASEHQADSKLEERAAAVGLVLPRVVRQGTGFIIRELKP